ncbi:MAG: (d)CMP kinase [Cytophagales bacterium]|nr:(d)CMP kinase [Cytophagales bacterium]
MGKKIIIAIDGFSGTGKSTTAKQLATKLGYRYIDTGAMYRATTLYCLENEVNLDSEEEVAKALDAIEINFQFNAELQKSETYLNGDNVEKEIRKMYVSENVSRVSAIALVRKAMVSQQQAMGKDKSIVLDGRDIGTVVFPEAELKIFMTTDVKVRAVRRYEELVAKGEDVTLESIIKNLEERDNIDSSRKESPLKKANDAFELDTTALTIEKQVEKVIELFEQL